MVVRIWEQRKLHGEWHELEPFQKPQNNNKKKTNGLKRIARLCYRQLRTKTDVRRYALYDVDEREMVLYRCSSGYVVYLGRKQNVHDVGTQLLKWQTFQVSMKTRLRIQARDAGKGGITTGSIAANHGPRIMFNAGTLTAMAVSTGNIARTVPYDEQNEIPTSRRLNIKH